MDQITEADLMPEGRTPTTHREINWGGTLGFSQKDARRLIGTVLYAYQYPDGTIKIGYTTKLHQRAYQYTDAKLLAICPGTHTDETAIHRTLQPHQANGREYYHPVPEVLAVINGWRDQCGMEPI